MSKPSDRLDGLRREADQISEPFSLSLHARIMKRVREEAAITPVASRSVHRHGYAVLSAAALLAIVVGVWFRTSPPPKTGPAPLGVSIDGGVIGQWLSDAADPITQSLDHPTTIVAMADLDQDAQTFGRFMLKQVGQLPRKRG